MNNAMAFIDKRFAVKNSGILAILALILILSNPRTIILHAKNELKVARRDVSHLILHLLSNSQLNCIFR